MCDQWPNGPLLEVGAHILSCVKCMYRKLDQFKQATEENKRKVNCLRKTKEDLRCKVQKLLPGPEGLEKMEILDVDLAYLDEKLMLVEGQVRDAMAVINMTLRARNLKRNCVK